jgi:glycerophosphoryl diester phosphodiesterase
LKNNIMVKKALVLLISFYMVACSSTKKNTSSTAPLFDMQGHRGARGLMPENTIPAMLKAIDLGVTTLEMDVVISKDRKVVVSHDPYFNENITTTPGGSLLSKDQASKMLLYNMDYDSIRKYDVGLKPHPLFPRQQKIAVSKPLLSELIQSAEAHASADKKNILYNIEIKSNPVNDGKKHPPVEEFVDLAMAVINQKGISSRTTIQSFDPRALQVMHKKYTGIKTALLVEDDDKRTLKEQLEQLGFTPSIYSPHYSLVSNELVNQCHQLKMLVIPWTINNLDEMKKQKKMGVDGIISDYPDLFAQL